MSGDIDNVVGAAHDEDVSALVDIAGIAGVIVARMTGHIRAHKAIVGIPERRQCAGRHGKLDRDITSRAPRHLVVSGWPIAGNPLGIEQLPVEPRSTAVPMPGWNVQCLDDEHNEVPRGTTGDIAIKLPMAPGALSTLWNADDRFVRSYMTGHPGYYHTGDAGYIDESGYIFIMSRTDDVINVAGHRLSTGAMEEVLASHPDVAECIVIGAADQLKGQVPL